MKLKNKKYTIGSWITLDSIAVAEIMCKSGFDWLCIDLEHTVIDYKELQNLIAIISYNNLEVFVRVGSNDELIIKKVLDAGADGIIVPLIKNAEDVKKSIEYSLYPPIGKRGVNKLSRAQGYGFEFENYLRKVNKKTKVIAQIEHIDAINDLENILKINNLYGTIIGPYDLSASLGLPGQFNHKKVKMAFKKYENITSKFKLKKGFHVTEPNIKDVKNKINKGYDFIAFSWDTYFLGRSCRDHLNKLK